MELGEVRQLVREALEHLLLLIAGLSQALDSKSLVRNVAIDDCHIGAHRTDVVSKTIDPRVDFSPKGSPVRRVLGNESGKSAVTFEVILARRGSGNLGWYRLLLLLLCRWGLVWVWLGGWLLEGVVVLWVLLLCGWLRRVLGW